MQSLYIFLVYIGERGDNLEDSKIIELYWSRSEDAIHESDNKYGKYLTKIAMNILKNNEDTQECINYTYLQTWNSIPETKPNSMRSFLGCITRNLSFDMYKKQRAKKRGNGEVEVVLEELEGCIHGGPDVEETMEENEVAKLISKFLRKQSRHNRVIFVRRYWYCDSIEDIEERFAISKSNVLSSLFRTRKALKVFLEKEKV